MKLNLSDYAPTGHITPLLLQLCLPIKSVQGYRLLNHLSKSNPSWLKNCIITSQNKLITSDLQNQIEVENVEKAQFLVAMDGKVERMEKVVRTKINMKEEGVVEYFVRETEFCKYEKKEREKESGKGKERKEMEVQEQQKEKEGQEDVQEKEKEEKVTKKAFEQLVLDQKRKKKIMKHKLAFLKRRRARAQRQKLEKQQAQKQVIQSQSYFLQ